MALDWRPTPYRKHPDDHVAVSAGRHLGLYRVKRERASGGFYRHVALFNGERIRAANSLAEAKQIAEEHFARIVLSGRTERASE